MLAGWYFLPGYLIAKTVLKSDIAFRKRVHLIGWLVIAPVFIPATFDLSMIVISYDEHCVHPQDWFRFIMVSIKQIPVCHIENPGLDHSGITVSLTAEHWPMQLVCSAFFLCAALVIKFLRQPSPLTDNTGN